MEEPLISVIVPVYNVEQYLDICVQSVIDQTWNNLEIILVDDGSTDGSPAMCDVWKTKDSRIKVIHKPNGGLSEARNKGLEVATGDYIAFVDSDDWIEPAMLATLLQNIQAENAEICSCGYIKRFEDHDVSVNIRPLNGETEEILRALYSNTAYPVAVWNKLYRREIWNGIRFPVGKLCEDVFVTYRTVEKAQKIVQISDSLYNYRIRPQSIMTMQFRPSRMTEEEGWRLNYEFAKKNYPSVANIARQHYVERVIVLLRMFTPEDKKQYSKEHRYLKWILTLNYYFLMKKSTLPQHFLQKVKKDYSNL